MKKILLLALALILLAAGLRMRQNRQNRARMFVRLNPLIETLDRDEDSEISASEIARSVAALQSLDRNHDGSLTEEELAPQLGRSGRQEVSSDDLARELMSFDRNGDGKLSQDEVPDRMRGLFTRGDINYDGFLDTAEINRLADITAAASVRSEFWPGGFLHDDPVASALDADHNGVISAGEILRAPEALKTLDRNHDGKLSLEEMRPPGAQSRR